MKDDLNDNLFIDVDCVGETTKKKYTGQFEVKLFLNHREMAAAAKEANRQTSGLSRTIRWDLKGFLAGLKDEWAGTEESEKLNLAEEQVNRIVSIAAISIPVGDAEADVMSVLALLNTHIVKSPDWWKSGYDLVDGAPIMELNKALTALQKAHESEA